MENILTEKIRTAKLTKSQREIAEYCMAHTDQLANMSSMELANAIGVSDASVIRFARAIGFDGYADLKQQVYQQLVDNANGGQSLLERLSNNAQKHGGKDSAERFLNLMESNMLSVFRDNPEEVFRETAQRLVRAQKRYIMGFRGTRGNAVHVARTMMFMLPNIQSVVDGSHDSFLRFHSVAEGDVVLMFVLSRFYRKDLKYIQTAKEHGAWVCLVTDQVSGPLSNYADAVIRVQTDNMSFFHSTIAVDLAGEYILNLISRQTDYKERVNALDEIAAQERL